uniref:Phospholipase B1, membrane-associated-like n=1 Tax=Saccoglossus kowalevskii TaxID=10224 RepID=A0ABM0MKE4_SACKO|nr:PREDICTED: phospholipase B1, membrane-associated-like [Saccoglossus kowalevskii]
MKLFFVFILSIVSASGFENESPEERWERYVQVLREYGPDEKNIMVSNDTPRLLQYKFECDILAPSATKPDSVHKLRPADIDIVAALGDSLTAANGAGASNPFQVLIEYRGLSWSIGGDNTLEDGTLTLSNILKMYNPNVKGWSIETGPADNHNISRLNVAVPGSTSIDMLEQVETLIQGLKTVKTLDYDNDWKLVTLFIGGNDLCAYCRDNDSYSAEQYATNVKAALDLMHVERSLEMLVEDGRYDTRDDFTVVIQPFFEETYIPPDGEGGWDGSMFAPDCFHFSEYGHQGCAMSLWNNMIERVGEKRKAWLPEDKLECPSEDFEYFYTYKNSNETEQNMDPIGDLDPIGQAYVVTMPSLTLLLTVMRIQHKFDCEIIPRSTTRPTSVHELTPGDIDIVAALGDSITAGNGAGASNPIQVIREYRGLSWSIGGDGTMKDETLTLPNILKQYNPEVNGWSVGIGQIEDYNISRLNVAEPGGKSKDLMDQTQNLIERLKHVDWLDYDNDWKMVTIFIGANDLCAYCHEPEEYTAENYAKNVEETLDYMHEEIPRTFVNLAQTVMVTEINKLDGCFCDLLHRFSCDCAKAKYSDDWRELLNLTNAYHRALETLVESGKYDTHDNFTVVIQPFFEETRIPPDGEGGWDDSFFAPDCFHFSEYGHQESAKSLWNNLIEPVGQKRTAWHPDDIVECPSEDFEYFYTYKNSPEITT